MTKFNELNSFSEDIAKTINSLNEEISNIECLYAKRDLLNQLKKENDVLEQLIDQYVKELKNSEIANGRNQVNISLKKNLNCDKLSSAKNTNSVCEKNDIGKSTEVKAQKKETKKVEKQKSTNIQKEAEKKSAAVSEDKLPVDIGRLDMKVGRIMEIQKHQDADSLYVEKIDVGREQPITVVSGLVKFVPIEKMKNRLVIVLCNLKPAKMRGILSEGMVMCASTPEKVEPLSPPTTSQPGDIISVPGYPPPSNGPDSVLNPKKKIFETLAPELLTDSNCFATFRGIKWEVSGDNVKCETLSQVNIK